jgi:hypothetical protein
MYSALVPDYRDVINTSTKFSCAVLGSSKTAFFYTDNVYTDTCLTVHNRKSNTYFRKYNFKNITGGLVNFFRARRSPPTSGAGKTQQQHPPPNNEELGPGICPKSPKFTRICMYDRRFFSSKHWKCRKSSILRVQPNFLKKLYVFNSQLWIVEHVSA